MQYEAKVYSEKQEVIVKQITAISEDEAARQLKNQGSVVLSIKPLKPSIARIGQANSKFPLLLFSHELYSLLKAGLSLMDSMETLKEKEHRPYAKAILTQVMNSLYEGLSLSVTLEQTQGAFPPLYIALIRSSEKTGNLPEALKRFVDYQMQVDVVRKKIISASIYPIILMLVGGLVILFLMLYVVPKFSEIFENQGVGLL